MSKKVKIVIGIIALVILILIIANIIRNKADNSEETTGTESTTLSDVKYNEDTGEYYIEDTETGEVLHTAYSEDELYIYSIDPDYDSKNPDAIDEYYEDMEEIEN